RVRVVHHDVARARRPVVLAVDQDIAAGGGRGFAQHAGVAVVVDAERQQHQRVAERDGGQHGQRPRAVPPQVAPRHAPEHQALPAIVGAGSILAARIAGHRPLSSATSSMTTTGWITLPAVITKCIRSENATPMNENVPASVNMPMSKPTLAWYQLSGRPIATPISAPMRPSTAVSTRMVRSIRRGRMPIASITPNSRRRSSALILAVFTMPIAATR